MSVPDNIYTEFEEMDEEHNHALWDMVWITAAATAFYTGARKVAGKYNVPRGIPYEVASRIPPYVGQARLYYEERGLEFVKTVTGTDKAYMKKLVADNWGKPREEFLSAVQQSGMLSDGRAMGIYRTETHNAGIAASHAWAKASRAKEKRWHHSGNPNFRPEHLANNGEVVPIDGVFSSGESMPGGPYCGCYLEYVF